MQSQCCDDACDTALLEINGNKKVLLRERKRHNACHVGSARYAALSSGGGVPHPRSGGYPDQVLMVEGGTLGTPQSRPSLGTPPPSRPG